jgi:uncharacterized protein
MQNFNLPSLRSGAGLRHEHFDEILESKPPFNWFEIITEDFMNVGGKSRDKFEEIRKHYKIIPHGVCMSIGSTDPLDMQYLKDLKSFAELIEAPWVSDHLCFTMVDHTNLVDLIPLPFTDEAVKHIVTRLKIIQDILEKPFLIENVTRYITISDREMGEAEFVSRILEEADCGLLLDVTNVHLNSLFHKYDALKFIRSLPLERVGQIHLAGWEPEKDGTIIDSHDAPVPPEVWSLFRETIALTGSTSVLIEWDKSLPVLDRLLEETRIADQTMQEVLTTNKRAA